jgi:hypothetical protein
MRFAFDKNLSSFGAQVILQSFDHTQKSRLSRIGDIGKNGVFEIKINGL